MNDGVHPVIGAYMSRRGLARQALADDGSLTLRVNGRYRLRLNPGRGRAVVMEIVLQHLPVDRDERDRLVERMLRMACLRLKDHPCGLVVDQYMDAVWLQRWHDGSISAISFDRAVTEFVASAAVWIEALRQ